MVNLRLIIAILLAFELMLAGASCDHKAIQDAYVNVIQLDFSEVPAEGAIVCGLNTDNGSQVHSKTNSGTVQCFALTGAQRNNENKRRIYQAAARFLQYPICARQSAQTSPVTGPESFPAVLLGYWNCGGEGADEASCEDSTAPHCFTGSRGEGSAVSAARHPTVL
ncbi:UNVERIFIED_CONTAM: hypothetical protein FKN15_043657 [Acipenser sinensis]